jgi:transcriptional regulator with XRE-family HTH domain
MRTLGNFRFMDTRFNGEALREARSARGLTHHQLARQVHLRLGERILLLEEGSGEPTPRLIMALAHALTVGPMQLLILPNGVDLKALRLSSGLSAAQLAQAAHVSERSYRRWESGEDLPLDNDRILCGLARSLDASPSQILRALRPREAPQPTETPATGEVPATILRRSTINGHAIHTWRPKSPLFISVV